MRDDAAIPAPKLPWLWATLTYVACALSLAHPALAGRFLVNGHSDQYIAGFAFRDYAAQALRAGEGFPQWNPYLFGGMPYIAAMHGDIFYPTFLLRMVLPTDVAMTWGMILHLLLAGLMTFAFARAVGLGFWGALVGGIAYMMSGQVASLVSPGHDGKLFISALFPLTLWLLTLGLRDGRAWAWGALALVSGLGVLTPHPQLYQYLLLASGAWALFVAGNGLALVRRGDGTVAGPLARDVAVRRLALALGAIVLGMAMGAVQFLPVKEYVPWSPRAGGQGYDFATSFSMPPEEFLGAWLPEFPGMLDAYWGRNPLKFHSEYLGAAALLLAIAAFGGAASTTGKGSAGASATGGTGVEALDARGLRGFLLGTAIVAAFWAMGGHTPFYQIVYALVPGSKFFRAPSTIYFVTTFAVAMLAGIGAERALRGRLTPRFVVTWMVVGGALGLLGIIGALGNVASAIAIPERMDAVEANLAAIRGGAFRSFLFWLVPALLIGMRVRGQLPARALAVALAALVATDLWSVERKYWLFSEPAAQLFRDDATTTYLKKLDAPARVIAMPLSNDGLAARDPFLFGDGLMVQGIRTVLGYHGNELGRYQKLGAKAEGWAQVGNPAFWQLTNAQYFYTNVDSVPIPGAERVAGPVQNAAGSTVSLFKLPGAHPLAWLASGIAKYPDAAVEEAVRAPNFPTYQVALFDTSAAIQAGPLTAIPEQVPVAVATTAYAPGKIDLTLMAPAPAGTALVVSENWFPGWTALVDGTPIPVYRANLSLMGVVLPQGARKVQLRFSDPAYATGKLVTLVAIAAALGWLLAGALGGRRAAPERDAHG